MEQLGRDRSVLAQFNRDKGAVAMRLRRGWPVQARVSVLEHRVNWCSGLFANDWATAYDVYFAIRLTTVS
jgi:hypothetical protein